jgi:murein DD-endopeptidase MepM/ murein hydrolase activator NlpD
LSNVARETITSNVHSSAKIVEVRLFRLSSLIMMVLVIANLLPNAAAQSADQYIVFARNGTLYAQTISTGEVLTLGATFANFEAGLPGYDVYTLAGTPILQAPSDGYGFHHGVWSLDVSRFAYLEIKPPSYRIRIQHFSGDNQVIFDGQLNPQRGYLDPIGWTADGKLMLLDRMLLNYLAAINIWQLDPTTLSLSHYTFMPVERLSGRSAMLPDGVTVFLGFNLQQNIGFLLDIPSGQLRTFSTQLGQILPPAKGFEYYPLQVFGGLNADKVANLTAQIQSSTNPAISPNPAPFLYWMLPDNERAINCYTDSVWTNTNFGATCPGLSNRAYEGHQGTDIGGDPNGLPQGTPVYPAASGMVVATHEGCVDDNPSCNEAYGNTVTLEHILIDKGETQVWYTGYGHLQSVLVEDYSYLTDLTKPVGLSGATGVGGAHLHFEVRSTETWVDPWDTRSGDSFWLGGNIHPLAATGESSEVLATCTSPDGNNIRNGAGTLYESVDKTVQDVSYDVVEVTFVNEGDVLGDWYHVQYEGGEGWLWFGLLNCL